MSAITSSDQFYLWSCHPLLVLGLITDTENSLGACEPQRNALLSGNFPFKCTEGSKIHRSYQALPMFEEVLHVRTNINLRLLQDTHGSGSRLRELCHMQARKTLRCQKGLTTALPWMLFGVPLGLLSEWPPWLSGGGNSFKWEGSSDMSET